MDAFDGGGAPSTGYVPWGKWHTAPETGSVFVHIFPCGIRAEVRVTASQSGVSVTSAPKQTRITDCDDDNGGGGALHSGAASKSSGAAAFTLGPPRPNPTTGRIVFDVGSEPAELSVFDALGRRVHRVDTAGPGMLSLDLSHLPAGAYVARLASDADAETQRFAITR